jgi:hypothetical protein
VGRTNNTRNALIAKREAALSRARTWQTTIRRKLVSQLHKVNWLFCAPKYTNCGDPQLSLRRGGGGLKYLS